MYTYISYILYNLCVYTPTHTCTPTYALRVPKLVLVQTMEHHHWGSTERSPQRKVKPNKGMISDMGIFPTPTNSWGILKIEK